MFELDLSKEIKIYSTFHILFLESTNLEFSVMIKIPGLELEDKYKIERIKDFDGINYLVK